MSVKLEEVHCQVRQSIPIQGETIMELFTGADPANISEVLEMIAIYSRATEECPFNRGNWIIDLVFKDKKGTCCVKLPIEMTKKEVENYAFPLTSLMTSHSSPKSNEVH